MGIAENVILFQSLSFAENSLHLALLENYIFQQFSFPLVCAVQTANVEAKNAKYFVEIAIPVFFYFAFFFLLFFV